VSEFCDGAFIVAFTTEGEHIILMQSTDQKTAIAINALTMAVMRGGGIVCPESEDDDAE